MAVEDVCSGVRWVRQEEEREVRAAGATPAGPAAVVWVAGERCPPRGHDKPHSGAVHHDGMPGGLLTSRAAWVRWVRVRAQGPTVGLGSRAMALAPALLSRLPKGPREGVKSSRGAQLSSPGVGRQRVRVAGRRFGVSCGGSWRARRTVATNRRVTRGGRTVVAASRAFQPSDQPVVSVG